MRVLHRNGAALWFAAVALPASSGRAIGGAAHPPHVQVRRAVAHDRSAPLVTIERSTTSPTLAYKARLKVATGENVEQTSPGTRPPLQPVASFDGLGFGFNGPQGSATLRNPSDNSLAVGRDHIVQIVNSRTAIFTKKGSRFDTTGRVLYGPVETRNVFKGFGGPCEARNNGDAVVRYDQLADRWLILMPIFSRITDQSDERGPQRGGEMPRLSVRGVSGQPGAAATLVQPPPPRPDSVAGPRDTTRQRAPQPPTGVYAMCYALSVGPDPLGAYYRYEFVRPLFPDYPRPAVWPDGYYVPTSTGDEVIQKHACVAERAKMLVGGEAREQCVVIDGVNFLNNTDLDGTTPPPAGTPNIMLAAGGRQLEHVLGDSVLLYWTFHVDWKDPTKTKVDGPHTIAVAPYEYLCGGQLTKCVPQAGTEQRLDAQGDKLMARVVYRPVNGHQAIVAVHSVNTAVGGGGVRWYELRLDRRGRVNLFQQGTYAPDSAFRWMASPAMDRAGNIGIGYSYGGPGEFAGQRFAGRFTSDPPGRLTTRETVLAMGEAAQTNTLRWQDYTQTAVDPSDDCTIWYVGDYLMRGATSYSTRIAALRFPGCVGRR